MTLANLRKAGGGFRMTKIWRAALACAALAFCTGQANAANVTSFNPESIVLGLQSSGYKAILKKSDDGDPIIETSSDGNVIQIVLNDCENHKSCRTSEFVGVWDCATVIEKCKQAALEINNAESPVHVILNNGGKTALTYSYLLFDEVGISESLLIKNLVTFNYYNNQFNVAVSKK